jgi:hypothetical protein
MVTGLTTDVSTAGDALYRTHGHHAQVPANAAKTLTAFVLDTLEYQRYLRTRDTSHFGSQMGKFTSKLLKRPRLAGRPTLAVTLDRPKTAALAFDHVYAPTDVSVPNEITAGFTWMDRGSRKQDMLIEVSFTGTDGTKNPALIGVSTNRAGLIHSLQHRRLDMFRALRARGFQPVEFLESYADTYEPGNDRHIFAVLEGLVDIDEAALSWSQVSEFRSDTDALVDYRRLVDWFNLRLKGAGVREAEDRLAATVEAAEAAMKKHGIVGADGIMAAIVPATVVAAIGHPWTAAGVAATLFGGRVVAKFWETRLKKKEELRSGPAAYVRRLEGLSRRAVRPSDEKVALPPSQGG